MTTYGEKKAELEIAKNTFSNGPDNIRRLTYELCNLDNNKSTSECNKEKRQSFIDNVKKEMK